ncbi:hypothetical protein C0J52_07010 [Blattella germanica]|nr:hypothetical protein C0J52_07010 [Blattella germanica]
MATRKTRKDDAHRARNQPPNRSGKGKPFIVLAPGKPRLETIIQMHAWELHFMRILNQQNKSKEENRKMHRPSWIFHG